MDDTPLSAIPDGMAVIAWREARGISRATAQRLLKAAGITPGRARVPGSRSPVAFLSAEQLEMLDAMAARLAQGATVTELSAALVRQEPAPPPELAQPGPSHAQARLSLPERLALIEAAERIGAPLTTEEAQALLLVKPKGDRVVVGPLALVRDGVNRWWIERA